MEHPKAPAEYGFLIPCHITSPETASMLRDSLTKIRRYHQEPIVLISDRSTVDIAAIANTFSNVSVEESISPGSGEINPYLSFYRNHQFTTAVILHDSMQLTEPLIGVSSVQDVQFIKLFTQHIKYWSVYDEPQTPYNVRHGIKKHDDLMLHLFDVCVQHKPDFYRFAKEIYHRKQEWVGCFGVMSIITHRFLVELQERTGVLDFAWRIQDKQDRCAMESIFAIACLFLRPLDHLKRSYDGDNTEQGKFLKLSYSR